MTNLSEQQRAALDKIAQWHEDSTVRGAAGDVFRLFGPAGTGKTTLAREVGDHLFADVMFAAYTGKAASVLRGKGCTPASTIHSLIYRPMSNEDAKARLGAAQGRRDEIEDYIASGELNTVDGIADELRALHAEIEALEREVRTVGWELNPDSPLAKTPPDLLILDEVSMVDAKLAADLESFGVPILVLGDPAQLPPVGGEGYYTDAAPDFLLTEIHRQALDSPVLRLATGIREGVALDLIEGPRHSIKLAGEHDQVLCWRNSTRWLAVKKLRALAGLPEGTPAAGDRVMCLTNNRDLGVFNGQQFEVLDTEPGTLGPALYLRDDEGHVRRILAFSDGFVGQDAQDAAKRAFLGGRGLRGLFTFAQAITTHKAQGSEWGSVYVVDETPMMIQSSARRVGKAAAIEEARRWLYTAVTRASDRVTIVRPGR